MLILGIETSCDETAAAVLEEKDGGFRVLSNIVSSQVKLHSKWGGVVPNLAAREHLKNIVPVIKESLKKSGITPRKLNLIAATKGPGLIPALLIGNMSAKTLSWLFQKPLVGIHHIEGHIYANFIEDPSRPPLSKGRRLKAGEVKFPLLCLVVSGGHTQLVLIKKHLDYEIVGQTLDDAAGEAFDKVARIFNLGYPGGPLISGLAKKAPPNNCKFLAETLPRPMIKSNNLDFSFSGLKTAALYLAKRNKDLLENKIFIQEVSREFQQAVIDVLIAKTIAATKKYRPKTISLAGGVSANQELRRQLGLAVSGAFPKIKYQIPDIAYSLDNAAMIAAAGCFRWKAEKNKSKFLENWKTLEARANLELK